MLGARGMVGGAVDKFKLVSQARALSDSSRGCSPRCSAGRCCWLVPPQVMNNKQNKQMLTLVGGFAVLLLLLYFLLFK
jgi:hypothetical protein